jgi:hypothetical protein
MRIVLRYSSTIFSLIFVVITGSMVVFTAIYWLNCVHLRNFLWIMPALKRIGSLNGSNIINVWRFVSHQRCRFKRTLASFPLSSQVRLQIINNSFCIVQRATAQSKTGTTQDNGSVEHPPVNASAVHYSHQLKTRIQGTLRTYLVGSSLRQSSYFTAKRVG